MSSLQYTVDRIQNAAERVCHQCRICEGNLKAPRAYCPLKAFMSKLPKEKKNCPNCHEEYEGSGVYCVHCGFRIVESNEW